MAIMIAADLQYTNYLKNVIKSIVESILRIELVR